MSLKIKNTICEQEWKDMPEFVQEKQKPYSQIIVRFETEYDLNAFAEKIGQKLTKKTKSIWYPFKSHFNSVVKEWTDQTHEA